MPLPAPGTPLAIVQDGIAAPGGVSACPREARGHNSSLALTLYMAPAELISQPGPCPHSPAHGYPAGPDLNPSCWPKSQPGHGFFLSQGSAWSLGMPQLIPGPSISLFQQLLSWILGSGATLSYLLSLSLSEQDPNFHILDIFRRAFCSPVLFSFIKANPAWLFKIFALFLHFLTFKVKLL